MKRKKSPKLTEIEVPVKYLGQVEDYIRELRDRDKPRKPIKRMRKFEPAELKQLTAECKVFLKKMDRIEREHERVENYFDRELTTADEKWVHQYQDELLKPVDVLRELVQLVNNM